MQGNISLTESVQVHSLSLQRNPHGVYGAHMHCSCAQLRTTLLGASVALFSACLTLKVSSDQRPHVAKP